MESNYSYRNLLTRWGPVLIITGVIFVFSSLPGGSIPTWDGILELIIKKGGHMIGYGLLGIAFHRAIVGDLPRVWVLAWFFTVLYGVSDELHQGFVPGRTSSILDVGIDGLGALLGLIVWFNFQKHRSS